MKNPENRRLKIVTRAAGCMICALFFTACTFSRLKNILDDGNSAAGLSGPAFSELKEKIFVPFCVQCHIQYSEYKFVKHEIGAIEFAIQQDRMPKNSAPLPGNLKQLLADWIAAGTPNTVAVPPPVEPPEGLQPTWESISTHIFVPKCISCHNPNGQAKWVDVSSRPGMIKTLLAHIDFENPEESNLIARFRDPEEPMPPLPPDSNIPQLTEDEIQVVIEWIIQGLP